jgi:hypothetical protein
MSEDLATENQWIAHNIREYGWQCLKDDLTAREKAVLRDIKARW